MRRSTLAVLLLTGLALAACAKKSIYLDSGRKETGDPTRPAPPPPNVPGAPAAPAKPAS